MMVEKYDPETFAACSEHVPVEVAQNNYESFFEKVYEARVEHKIADVVLIVQQNAIGDGKEGTTFNAGVMGDSRNHLLMVAEAYGQMKAQRDAELAALVSGKRRKAKSDA